jgi:CheY-like chemotaxis protein
MNGKKTVLYVEDDQNDTVLVQRACLNAKVSFDMQVVNDGAAAIAYLTGVNSYSDRQRHPLPIIIMLDLKMPRQNGFEVLHWIRSQRQFKELPVIVFSSSKHEGDMKRAYDTGANSYLVKPVDFDALVEMVKSINVYWLQLNRRPQAGMTDEKRR